MLCSQLLEELEEPKEAEEVRMSIRGEDFKQTASDIIEAFEAWLAGVPEWQVEEPNYEGVRVMVMDADRMQTGWLLLRSSLHDPLLVVNAESEVEGGTLPGISYRLDGVVQYTTRYKAFLRLLVDPEGCQCPLRAAAIDS